MFFHLVHLVLSMGIFIIKHYSTEVEKQNRFYEKNELCIIHILSANSICKMSLSKIQNFLFFESGDYVKTTRFFT